MKKYPKVLLVLNRTVVGAFLLTAFWSKLSPLIIVSGPKPSAEQVVLLNNDKRFPLAELGQESTLSALEEMQKLASLEPVAPAKPKLKGLQPVVPVVEIAKPNIEIVAENAAQEAQANISVLAAADTSGPQLP
jgi:hypothetical protein